MLVDILPEDVATEVTDGKHVLDTVDTMLTYLSGELSIHRDKELTSFHDRKAEHALDSAPKNPVHSFVEVETKVQDMMKQMESMISAFGQANAGQGGDRQRLPKPDPSFSGCWHCGAKDHSRRKCPKFKRSSSRRMG